MSDSSTNRLTGWKPDFSKKVFHQVQLTLEKGQVSRIDEMGKEEKSWQALCGENWLLPGLVDAHVHIESSMLSPGRFAEMVVDKGTVATVSDPHEIANVMGEKGLAFMQAEAARTAVKIYFTIPSCVPATPLETAGARLDATRIQQELDRAKYVALGEMMNFPGVIQGATEVLNKIKVAQAYGLPVDGHAPGVTGSALRSYIEAGITTDHECTTLEEAREKITMGMHILIREGSAARNFESLYPLIDEYPDQIMLCCDDIHPDDLCEHHIDSLITEGLRKGLDFFNLYAAASLNPVDFYGLDVGQLQVGDPADLIVATWEDGFRIKQTWIDGKKVFDGSNQRKHTYLEKPVNRFDATLKKPSDFMFPGETGDYRVMGVIDGELITRQEIHPMIAEDQLIRSDCTRDILKIALINRYADESPAVGLIRGFGLTRGAIASSIAHDSHHLVAVGVTDEDLSEAVNLVVRERGGISAYNGSQAYVLPLPVAGLMSQMPGSEIAEQYKQVTAIAFEMGSTLKAPFMTLSFMALLVIPELKIGEKGLFDGQAFTFVENRIT